MNCEPFKLADNYRRFTVTATLFVLLHLLIGALSAQSIGDVVRLASTNPQGVPVHPAAGDPSYLRWNNGSTATIAAIDPTLGWFKVDSVGKSGWVTRSYFTVIQTDPDGDGPDSGSAEAPICIIGTWNLEWLKDGAHRGFPEDTTGGPSYGSGSMADYQWIAGIIRTQLFTKILVLNEINGTVAKKSDELDRLVGILGNGWTYDIAASGGSQRTALLYDTRAVRRDALVEISIPESILQGKDIFERDPLAAKFTLLGPQGEAKNDLVVVGLHLASGQQLVANHNQAMATLRTRLHQAFQTGSFPQGEKDVVLLGDFNANRYDANNVEDFWAGYDSAGFNFRTLAPADEDEYPPTRMAGVPLFPRSRIDYVLSSGVAGGLTDELVQLTAHVHTELLQGGFDTFRAHVSDHLPVTIRIRVVPDDD